MKLKNWFFAIIFMPQMQVLTAPASYPLLSSWVSWSSIQSRLQTQTKFLESWCHNLGSDKLRSGKDKLRPGENELVCQAPVIIHEIDSVTAKLAEMEKVKGNLLLHLNAGLHSEGLFTPPGEAFSSLYVRYLLALRQLHEVWPSVLRVLVAQGQFKEPIDRFIEPWLSAESPWDFMMRSIESLSCVNPDECDIKNKLWQLLNSAVSTLRRDSTVASLMDRPLFPDATRSYIGAAEFRVDEQRMQELLRGVLWNEPGPYLFMQPDPGNFEENKTQIAKYYALMRESSTLTLQPKRFSNEICLDSMEVLKTMAANAKPWFNVPPVDALKSVCNGTEKLPVLFAKIQATHDLYTFNYFHLRMAIESMYPHNSNISAKAASNREKRRLLMVALSVLQRLRPMKGSLDPVLFHESERKEWTKLLDGSLYDALPALGGNDE